MHPKNKQKNPNPNPNAFSTNPLLEKKMSKCLFRLDGGAQIIYSYVSLNLSQMQPQLVHVRICSAMDLGEFFALLLSLGFSSSVFGCVCM